MTVIAAARTKDGITMAADSLTSAGWEKLRHDRPKLWTSGQYLIGAAGDVRTAQVIRHNMTWPKFRDDEVTDVEQFVVKEVIPALRVAVANQAVVITKDGRDSTGVVLLVAWGDHLAEIHNNYAVTLPTMGRHAIGSGYAEALGSLGDMGRWTRAQVIESARVATLSAHGCEGPLVVADTRRLKVEDA